MRTHRLRGSVQVAVIGGNGFLGRSIVHRLSSYPNIRIFSIDRRQHGVAIDTSKAKSIVEQIVMDVGNEGAINSWLMAHPVDVIIFAAGYENPTDGLNPTFIEDARAYMGLTQTLASIHDMPLEKDEDRPYFMYISSASVYGTQKKLPILEGATELPSNFAGMNKLLCEDLVKKICTKLGAPYSILRPTEVYGRHHHNELKNKRFWPGYLSYYTDKLIRKEEVIDVFSPDTEIDLVNINYFSKVVVHFIENQVQGVFNVASGNRISILDLVLKLQKAYGEDSSRITTSNRLNIDNMSLSTSALHKMIPYDYEKYNLDTFIKDYLPVRRYEIGKQMAVEQILSEPVILDPSAIGHKEAFEARKLRRRLAYNKIKEVAGPEFFKIKIGGIQDRHQALLSEEQKETQRLLELAKEAELRDKEKVEILLREQAEVEVSEKKKSRRKKSKK